MNRSEDTFDEWCKIFGMVGVMALMATAIFLDSREAKAHNAWLKEEQDRIEAKGKLLNFVDNVTQVHSDSGYNNQGYLNISKGDSLATIYLQNNKAITDKFINTTFKVSNGVLQITNADNIIEDYKISGPQYKNQ